MSHQSSGQSLAIKLIARLFVFRYRDDRNAHVPCIDTFALIVAQLVHCFIGLHAEINDPPALVSVQENIQCVTSANNCQRFCLDVSAQYQRRSGPVSPQHHQLDSR